MADEKFDPKKSLVVNCSEIKGFEDLVGRFVFKRPNIKDNIAISVSNAKKTEGVDLPTGFSNMAWVISTLEVVLVDKPKDLDFEELYDMDPIYELFNKYVKWESSFRKLVSDKQETASEK